MKEYLGSFNALTWMTKKSMTSLTGKQSIITTLTPSTWKGVVVDYLRVRSFDA